MIPSLAAKFACIYTRDQNSWHKELVYEVKCLHIRGQKLLRYEELQIQI
jgi:hypothetical protein